MRLTKVAGQDAEGLIPGSVGETRLHYSDRRGEQGGQFTEWQRVLPEQDHAFQFELSELRPGTRYYYHAEMRLNPQSPSSHSVQQSFLTAPAADQNAPVFFHVTTCQDLHGDSTYEAMAAQQPDFCISAGDNVYYDGQCLARTVPEAWQAYQKMFGLRGCRRTTEMLAATS